MRFSQSCQCPQPQPPQVSRAMEAVWPVCREGGSARELAPTLPWAPASASEWWELRGKCPDSEQVLWRSPSRTAAQVPSQVTCSAAYLPPGCGDHPPPDAPAPAPTWLGSCWRVAPEGPLLCQHQGRGERWRLEWPGREPGSQLPLFPYNLFNCMWVKFNC